MQKVLRIIKLLIAFIVAIAGFIYADSYVVKHSLRGVESIIYLALGIVPGALALWLLDSDVRKQIGMLLRPVSLSVWLWRVVGFMIASCGFLLLVGNQTGKFTSFPFAGTLVLIIGVAVISVKGKG